MKLDPRPIPNDELVRRIAFGLLLLILGRETACPGRGGFVQGAGQVAWDRFESILSGGAQWSRSQGGALSPAERRTIIVPVAGVRPEELVDSFGDARGGSRQHEALDIMAARGTPVVAADDGEIVSVESGSAGGLVIYQLDDSRTWCYYYAHLDSTVPGLERGQTIRRGERIGAVGSSGNASPSAPHLHFAISRFVPGTRCGHGDPVNPLRWLRR